MSATQTIPAVVPVAPVVAVAQVAHIAPVAPIAPVALVALVAPVAPVAPVTPGRRPSRGPTKAHKNANYVLEKSENEGSGGTKRTKTPILCSKCPKMGVLKAKKAQKPRFCARNARKLGFRRAKAHKNPDFVLERKGIGTRERGN